MVENGYGEKGIPPPFGGHAPQQKQQPIYIVSLMFAA